MKHLTNFEKTMQDTIGKSITSSQRVELENFSNRISRFGANFAVCDAACRLILLCEGGRFESCREELIECSRETLEQNKIQMPHNQEASICRFGNNDAILCVVLETAKETAGVALIDTSYTSADNDGTSEKQKEGDVLCKLYGEMLAFFAEKFRSEAKASEQIELVSTELAQVYEELVLLHKLSINMNLTEGNGNFLQMACDSLTDIVNVEGIAILLENNVEDNKLNLTAGSGLIDIDEHMAAIIHNRLLDEINIGHEAMLDSEVDSPFRYDWSESIRNIIVVPLSRKAKSPTASAGDVQNEACMMGFMVAVNRLDKQDFDSTDVKLFTSVAGGCAVFVENGRLFKDLEELFVGSLRALTNSIDAKDPYTRGHSERVAFISKWIAERLVKHGKIKQEDVPKIYLAGLLHDIGKMGVDEAVLRKQGKLTEQELDCIRTHPSIGASILTEIKQMHDIVSGVLCHHERVDGKGYPNGISGGQIPLMSKIIGLADAFDAMTSRRSYRNAMSVREALEEVKKGLGTQFDEETGSIFLDSDVYKLWDIIQEGFSGVHGNGVFSEYGTLAVGTLLR